MAREVSTPFIDVLPQSESMQILKSSHSDFKSSHDIMGDSPTPYFSPNSSTSSPHACARGKAIGLSVVIVVGMKIARSRVLVICACYKHNQLVDIGEKLVCTRFELLKKAY